MKGKSQVNRALTFLTEYSLLLVLGALIALTWANIDYSSYHHFVEYPIWDGGFIGHAHMDSDGHVHRTLTLHYLVNDLFMAFFFAIAGKEVWEAVALKSGPLRGKKSFEPINMNGSQRGWRPIVHFFDQRITEIKILEGTELNPVITDDFIMIPNPKTCDPKKEYKVIFEATPKS